MQFWIEGRYRQRIASNDDRLLGSFQCPGAGKENVIGARIFRLGVNDARRECHALFNRALPGPVDSLLDLTILVRRVESKPVLRVLNDSGVLLRLIENSRVKTMDRCV